MQICYPLITKGFLALCRCKCLETPLFHSGSVEPSYHPVLLVLCHCISITQDELKFSMPLTYLVSVITVQHCEIGNDQPILAIILCHTSSHNYVRSSCRTIIAYCCSNCIAGECVTAVSHG